MTPLILDVFWGHHLPFVKQCFWLTKSDLLVVKIIAIINFISVVIISVEIRLRCPNRCTIVVISSPCLFEFPVPLVDRSCLEIDLPCRISALMPSAAHLEEYCRWHFFVSSENLSFFTQIHNLTILTRISGDFWLGKELSGTGS